MKVNRLHLLFFEDLWRQHLQNKKALHSEVFRQELLTIQASSNYLPDAVIPETLADLA